MSSYYYKYPFVSPDPLFAVVKEELKSYFDTGAIDDLMFPIWTDNCLRKLGRGSYKIEHGIGNVCDFEFKLPPDFYRVREAWLTTSIVPQSIQKPGAFYQEVTTCMNVDYVPDPTNCYNTCNPQYVDLVYKTTSREHSYNLQLKYLLQPGTVGARHHCAPESPNLNVNFVPYSEPGDHAPDSFDIRGNKFVTNFREAQVYLLYYSKEYDENGYQLVPDNYRIQEFIKAFLRHKVFEQLYNQVTDETFNQIQTKYEMYEKKAQEAYIIADIEIKKETVYDKIKAIKRDQHRYDRYVFDMYGRPGGRGFPKNIPFRRY